MFFLFHSVYQLYAHVLCMFLQKNKNKQTG